MHRMISNGIMIAILLGAVQSIEVSAAALPTEQEVKGIQNLCGAGSIQSVTIKGNLDAALKTWRRGAASASAEVARSNLTGALGRLKSDAAVAPVYKIYIDCVGRSIQQFIDGPTAEKPKKIGANLYFQTGQGFHPPANWAGPGIPAPDFMEISRSEAELVPGETYWIPPVNQSVPASQECPAGGRVGQACTLDKAGRIVAYTRVNCGEASATGQQMTSGCSRASPPFSPSRRDVLAQCCYYKDSPAKANVPFNHSLSSWLFHPGG